MAPDHGIKAYRTEAFSIHFSCLVHPGNRPPSIPRNVFLRFVLSHLLRPHPTGQQLQRALRPAVPGLHLRDPTPTRGGHPARAHPQLLPPEHRRGILSVRGRREHPQLRGGPHQLGEFLGIWGIWGLWVQPALPPLSLWGAVLREKRDKPARNVGA